MYVCKLNSISVSKFVFLKPKQQQQIIIKTQEICPSFSVSPEPSQKNFWNDKSKTHLLKL